MEIIDTERQTLKDIVAGKYRNCYLVYARKSTDEPDNQKNSIKYQRGENTKFAQRESLAIAPVTLKGFSVDGIVSERHSGFKEDNEISMTASGMVQYRIERPKFQRLIQFLSRGSFKGIIVLCWDRVSRNRGDDTVVRKLMKKGVDVRFVYATYEKTSAGALHMDIDGMFAEHHSRVTAEKVTKTMASLRERGICTYKAPIGYLNEGRMEHKPFDPVRSPIIKRMFEILAAKEWSLSDLTAWANQQGLTTVPSRRRRTPDEMLAEEEDDIEIEALSRPMTITKVHRILTNPFYTGKILGIDGTYIPSTSHQPLVTEQLFNKAHQALNRKRSSVHYAETLDLPARGLVRCADCRRVYTPYTKKGIYYFYARCQPNCPNKHKNFNLDFLEREITKSLSGLSFTDDELANLEALTKTDISILENKRHAELEEGERCKKKLREDLAYLRANKLSLLKTGVYSPESFMEEENSLNASLTSLHAAEEASDASMHEVIKDLVKLSELVKYGSGYYEMANSREKEQLARIIFSELSVSGNTLIYQCKNGFKALQNRFSPVCDHTEWLSEAVRNNNHIQDSIESLMAMTCKSPLCGP